MCIGISMESYNKMNNKITHTIVYYINSCIYTWVIQLFPIANQYAFELKIFNSKKSSFLVLRIQPVIDLGAFFELTGVYMSLVAKQHQDLTCKHIYEM